MVDTRKGINAYSPLRRVLNHMRKEKRENKSVKKLIANFTDQVIYNRHLQGTKIIPDRIM